MPERRAGDERFTDDDIRAEARRLHDAECPLGESCPYGVTGTWLMVANDSLRRTDAC